MRKQVETRAQSTDHPLLQRAVGRPKMYLIMDAVAKAAGKTADFIRTNHGHILRSLVAWLGWHEGLVTLRSIAASLRLRSEGHISVLVKRCEEAFSENDTLLDYHDQCTLLFDNEGLPTRFTAALPLRGEELPLADWGEGMHGAVGGRNTRLPVDLAQVHGYWRLDCGLAKRIHNFLSANSGLTIAGAGSYWRSLYFSVMTVTTVGYGDIVPITTRARLFVAVQSLLGVVMLGLFLNSLALQIAHDVSHEPMSSKFDGAQS